MTAGPAIFSVLLANHAQGECDMTEHPNAALIRTG